MSQTTLDIIGLAVLGYELNSLSTSSALANHYNTVFASSKVGQIISVIHQAIPIRWALPIKANLDFINANAQVRVILREHIRRRKEEVARNPKSSPDDGIERDLLTLMIEEKLNVTDGWTEDEILGHVRIILPAASPNLQIPASELHGCGPRDHSRRPDLGIASINGPS
jgi:cytochrome P450